MGDLGLQAPPGTRFVEAADKRLLFTLEGLLAERVTFDDILQHHNPKANQFALLRTFEGHVAGVAAFTIRDDDLFLDYLSRRREFRGDRVSVGAILLNALQRLAWEAARRFIRLESVSDAKTLAWYESRGFEIEGRPFADPAWGLLYPMVRSVGRP